MEEIYLKGYLGRREWCSEKVRLKSYFERFSALGTLSTKRKMTTAEIMQYYVPQLNQCSKDQLIELAVKTDGSQLTKLFHKDLIKKPGRPKKDCPSTSKSVEDSDNITIINSFSESSRKKNRINNDVGHVVRKEVILDAAENVGTKDLIPKKDFLVSFRIHEQFLHKTGDNQRPGRCVQQVSVLGHQDLCALRDKIICESDFQDTRGDISERPDELITKRARDVYRSGMFYIDNTFYVDMRHAANADYSKVIKEWGRSRGIKFGDTKSMTTHIEDLEVRFGYPYLYLHQGSCEHLITINDARLLSTKDSLHSLDYPLMSKLTHGNMIYCMTCSRLPAKWIVKDSDLLAHDPTFQCRTCFKYLHYVNGKKVCNFKAYQYWQRSTIL